MHVGRYRWIDKLSDLIGSERREGERHGTVTAKVGEPDGDVLRRGDRDVPMIVRSVPPATAPTWASRSSEAASAQCRSSSTTASGPTAISASLIWASAANLADFAAARLDLGFAGDFDARPFQRGAPWPQWRRGFGGAIPATTADPAARRTASSMSLVLPTPPAR